MSWLRPSVFWLFAFIPVAIALESMHASAPMIFFAAALSIIPIAKLIGASTENLSTYTGDALGGLLNATFGNLPELIISIVALRAGLYDMVLASLIGAILANLLLAMGVAFFLGGMKFHNQEYNAVSIRIYSSMMMIAVFSLVVPSAFHQLFGADRFSESVNSLNIAVSIALLTAYVLYLVFMLRTHTEFFKSASGGHGEDHSKRWSLQRAIISLLTASAMAAYMSEILVGAAEETGEVLGMSPAFIGVIFLAVIGGAAESISAITMASKNKMDLSIGILLGSSIQIALFVAPFLVIASLFMGPSQLTLSFHRTLIGALLLAVIIGTMVTVDGKSNWYKGVQLILVYLLLAMMLYFVPSAT